MSLPGGMPGLIKMTRNDWKDITKKIIDELKVETFLEFGLGISTLDLLRWCDKVVSVEVITEDNPYWFKLVKGFNNPRWSGYYLPNEGTNTATAEKISEIITKHKPDIILVDAEPKLRGWLINQSFGKANVIVAHDTNRDGFNWQVIEKPEDYQKLHFTHVAGTTFWARPEEFKKIEKYFYET